MSINIKEVQKLLVSLGHEIEVDGIWGPKSQAAMDAALGSTSGSEIPNSSENKSTGTFWDEIQHFTREEFRCPCGKCGGFPVEPREEIVRICEETREHFGKPMTIVPPDGHSGGSGVRCAEYNATLGCSVSNSRHLEGKAVDFSVQGVSGTVAKAWCDRLIAQGRLRYAYIIGGNNVHMDIL